MKAVNVLFIFLVLCSVTTHAQLSLSGRVGNTAGKPLSLVSVSLLQDSNFIAGAVTEEDGRFHLSVPGKGPGQYSLRISRVGFQPMTRVFTYPDTAFMTQLALTEQKNMLGEVTVTAKKPLVTRKSDRYIVNVEDSYLANGRTGMDVLQQSPGLWVKPDGSIRLRGNQSVTVMINDVVQRMSEADLADYLRSLKSEDISKIEVIPNPPAEYEASSTGGIVHIVLKKKRRDGLTGSVSTVYRQQGSKPQTGIGSMLDYGGGRLYLYGSYNYGIDRSIYHGSNYVIYPDKSSLYNSNLRDNDNTRQTYRFAAAWDFSPSHTINLQSMGGIQSLLQHFYSGIQYNIPGHPYSGNVQTDWIRHPKQNSTTLNYAWKIDTAGSFLKIIADYTTSSKTEVTTLHSLYTDTAQNNWTRTSTPSTTDIYSAQADYNLAATSKSSFKTGVKLVETKRHNIVIGDDFDGVKWTNDPAADNDFVYDEKLLMGYAAWEQSFKATSIKAGLRGEQTWSNGHSLNTNASIDKNYFGLFPSFFADHTLDAKKGNSIHLNYSRRVRRPGFNDLNPYRLQVHDYTILTGNPDLLPQYAHSVQGGYTWHNNYSAEAYFQSTQNFIAQTSSIVDSNIIQYQSKNYSNSTEYGLTLNGSQTIKKIWNINCSVLLYHVSTKLDPTFTQTSFSIKLSNTLSVKKIADFDMYIEYNSPYLNANSRQYYYTYMQLGATRRILKGKGRLRLNIEDPLNMTQEKTTSDYQGTHIDFYQKRPTRTFSLSFNYNFKAGKVFSKKKIDPVNSDERNRL